MFKKIADRRAVIFLLLILALAVFWRFWNLEQIPPGLYPDVAVNGTNALEALKTDQFKLFYPDNNGREGLFINLIASSFWLFGASIWAIKVIPALFGSLTVLGLFLLTKQIFAFMPRAKAEFIALLSTFFIAVGFWHVNFSRIGFRAIMVPFFLVWSFYFLFKGKNEISNRTWTWILAGLFFGLGFHTYIAYRAAPLILLPIVVLEIIAYWPRFKMLLARHRPTKTLLKRIYISDGWWRWDVFFAVLIIVALPMGIYFLSHPQDFFGRAGQVSIFSSANPLKELLVSTVKTLGMFNVRGDCNWRHNYACQPELLWPVGIFFLIGFFWSVVQIFRPANYKRKKWLALITYWTLIFWLFTMLLPDFLSAEGLPHALRAIGAIPPVYIFSGLGLFLIFDFLRNRFAKKGVALIALYLILFVTLGLIAYAEFNKYFFDWGLRKEVKAEFTQRLVDEGNYLNSLPDGIEKYVMVNETGVPVPYPDGIPMPAQTIMFITYGRPNIKYLLPSENGKAFLNTKQAVLIPLSYDGNLFRILQERIRGGHVEEIQKEFSVYKIGF